MKNPYEFTDDIDLLAYAKYLEGKSIAIAKQENKIYQELVSEIDLSYGKRYKGKGSFGQFIEEAYFGIRNNSDSFPDFGKLGIELKVSPLKHLQNGEIRVKERLVLNHINYNSIVKETKFENSHFVMKNALLLLIFYYHNNELEMEDKLINLVDIWEFIKRDYKQIKEDWETIINKVRNGKAHEISEGDTIYLGACTKGATAESSMQKQPYSPIMARGRALCFKTSYINHIYKTLVQERNNNPEDLRFLKPTEDKTLEEAVLNLFNPYLGRSSVEIQKMLNIWTTAKNKHAIITRKIIGYNAQKKRFYEFDAAGIQIKTVRIEPNGIIKEHMSFKQIQYKDIIHEDWEDSTFYQELVSKFIIVIFKRFSIKGEYHLTKVKFWNMPQKHIDYAQKVWEITKEKILEGNFTHFPRAKQNPISHVRPKGQTKNDLMETENYGLQKKYCFWLNRDYVLHHIIED